MKKLNGYYFEVILDANKLVEQNGDFITMHCTKEGLLFWYDTYKKLAKQDAKVNKFNYNGIWYKHIDSTCLDLRAPKKQNLLSK